MTTDTILSTHKSLTTAGDPSETETLAVGHTGVYTVATPAYVVRVVLSEDPAFGLWNSHVIVYDRSARYAITNEYGPVDPSALRACRDALTRWATAEQINTRDLYNRPDYLAMLAREYWQLIK